MYVCIIFISLTITSNTSIPHFNFIISSLENVVTVSVWQSLYYSHQIMYVCIRMCMYMLVVCVYVCMYVHMLVSCTYVCKYVGYMYVHLHKHY